MSRVYVMTTGLFLIFLGLQVFLTKSFILTPDASKFVAERFQEPTASEPTFTTNAAYSPFNQTSYQYNSQPYGANYQLASNPLNNFSQQSMTPPSWLSWPILFFGVVVFLHGIALRKN